ncbi:hypothetical protein [Microbacterium thalli]|uniref:hypothetical protein n=1 Tax=Microbacterium thalli TaxID=3027921 RepID=UPI0023657792|nr:hypothetical protein [Microbacterium thalli]MDD7928354.1 hypothetical protein [Microbacterium thalli]
MSRAKAWIAISIVAVAAIVVLILVAALRYSAAPVYPALPAPDYALQEAIAYGGVVAVGAVGVFAGLVAQRDDERRTRVVVIGIAGVVALCVVAVVAALVVPAA